MAELSPAGIDPGLLEAGRVPGGPKLHHELTPWLPDHGKVLRVPQERL